MLERSGDTAGASAALAEAERLNAQKANEQAAAFAAQPRHRRSCARARCAPPSSN